MHFFYLLSIHVQWLRAPPCRQVQCWNCSGIGMPNSQSRDLGPFQTGKVSGSVV